MDDDSARQTRRASPQRRANSPRSNTPSMGISTNATISPTSPHTKISDNTPPPLPTRPKPAGSVNTKTTFIPPTEIKSPPHYTAAAQPPFREPELVYDDDPPDLIPSEEITQNAWTDDDWNNSSVHWDWTQSTSGSGTLPISVQSASYVAIDGRNEDEELRWWDEDLRTEKLRPGAGLVPPVLEDLLHDSAHTLLTVTVTPPENKLTDIPRSPAPLPSPSSDPVSSAPTHASPPFTPPSADEVRTAIPHPNAYYCRKDNSWIIFLWKSSSVLPPLAQSFKDSVHPPLPDQARRKRTHSCVGDGEQPFGLSNLTHHLHRYDKAIDSHDLSTPFNHQIWERGVLKPDNTADQPNASPTDAPRKMKNEVIIDNKSEAPKLESNKLHLYGVIPGEDILALVKDKDDAPPVGKSGKQAVVMALEIILQIIYNTLWGGEIRMLRTSRPKFQKNIGNSPLVTRIFEALGFYPGSLDDGEQGLRPPLTDVQKGKHNRARLLRAWIEIGAWLADYDRTSANSDPPAAKRWVKADSARDEYQRGIGAHIDQIPRWPRLEQLAHVGVNHWKLLGLTPSSYSPQLLMFSYLAQCRCDPARTVEYFTAFVHIATEIQAHSDDVEMLMVSERDRNRFTLEELAGAAKTLDFGIDGSLGFELDSDVPDNFIESAWKECVKRAWKHPTKSTEMQREANDALHRIAEARGSGALRKIWEDNSGRLMNPDRAYENLEVPHDTDESMLALVYGMRLSESPSQVAKWREALTIIADIRGSERLRQLALSGIDPGDITLPTRMDLPRGLNQLGNTCYLNSLLQYFYTIKDLRDAVTQLRDADAKDCDEKLTDDDLKRHRVGGRLVTRREIVRSKKFVSQLSQLFRDLEFSETAAVTPTLDLAKLALVTSRDEEEDENDKAGTDSSNDTDATLVNDAPTSFAAPMHGIDVPRTTSPSRSSGSILGKRLRGTEDRTHEMSIDSDMPEPEPTSTSSPIKSTFDSNGAPSSSNPTSVSPSALDGDGDTQMRDASVAKITPPPLARKATDGSSMMFGRQHDVAECMDNCMFQIETALLKFDDTKESMDNPKSSIVKSLFYGQLRQRLAIIQGETLSRPSMHEKEDLFSHLPVNVTNDGTDIYDGLSSYFDDAVEFEGKNARMEVSLLKIPPILQIQLQRVQFNRDTLQAYKSQAYVKFGETLYMDRYLDSADPEKKIRSKKIQSELSKCRDRLHSLSAGKDAPFTSILSNTLDYLSKLGPEIVPVEDEEVSELNNEIEVIKAETEELRTRTDILKAELEDLWKDEQEAEYELTSVFIHRGSSPSWGHYFFYSRHLPDNPDSWFKYNDSEVSVSTKEEILADTTGSTANPYLLVFARKGMQVVDTVKRYDPYSADES